MPWVKQPRPLITVEHAKDAMGFYKSGDTLAFARWCSDHAGMVAETLQKGVK